MKVILEHNEVIEAVKEYAAKRLGKDVKNIDVKINARKGRKFDANVVVINDTNESLQNNNDSGEE